MRIFVQFLRIVVGVLFIFSGLVKINDPSGLSYKMQEFFEVWGWHAWFDYSLLLSVSMNTLEVVLGLALLMGYMRKLVTSILLLLILFFTFLTSYVLFSGKIKACGCLGDCIPLTPIQTFGKDVVLTVFCFILWRYNKFIHPIIKGFPSHVIVSVSLVLCVLTQQFVLDRLPFYDCLPYKVGANIIEQMKMPEGATADVYSYVFTYKKGDKVLEFDENNIPDSIDDSYEFKGRTEKLIKKGNGLMPKIVDFTLKTKAGNDTTNGILQTNEKYVMLLVKQFPSHENTLEKRISDKILTKLEKRGTKLIIATADINHAPIFTNKNITLLSLDGTVIKTAARVNPTYFVMQGATILAKYSYADADEIFKHLN